MLVLGMETSARGISLAVLEDDNLKGEFSLNIDTPHSVTLLLALDMLLKQTGHSIGQVDGIAVSIGPGAFTSLRIGIATAKGLGMALDKPLVGVSTLETLAWGIGYSPYDICPILDAKKRQVYTARYQYKDKVLLEVMPPNILEPKELAAQLSEPVVFTGDGVAVYGDILAGIMGHRPHFAPPPLRQPRAAWVAYLGLEKLKSGAVTDAQDLLPLYIRRPEAEEKKAGSGLLDSGFRPEPQNPLPKA